MKPNFDCINTWLNSTSALPRATPGTKTTYHDFLLRRQHVCQFVSLISRHCSSIYYFSPKVGGGGKKIKIRSNKEFGETSRTSVDVRGRIRKHGLFNIPNSRSTTKRVKEKNVSIQWNKWAFNCFQLGR